MLFANFFIDGCWGLLVLWCLFSIALKSFMKKHDSDGKIGKAVTGGVADWIIRRLK